MSILENCLSGAESGIVFGEPGVGKSFLALDLGMAVARGTPWFGMHVRQGPVVYIAAVGATGFSRRVAACLQINGLTAAPGGSASGISLSILAAEPNLLCRDDVDELCSSINAQSPGGTSLIIFDSLAWCMVGAGEDRVATMRVVQRNCQYIHESTGATVVLVDCDDQKSVAGSAGWDYLRATANFELTVTRNAKARHLQVSTSMGHERGPNMEFLLKQVVVGTDEDGDPISSCVVAPIATPVPTPVTWVAIQAGNL